MDFRVKVFAVQAKNKGIVLEPGLEPGLLGAVTISIPVEKLSDNGKLFLMDSVEETAREWMENVVQMEITEIKE